ncbi:type II toxin-antitoxin system ParD family antitoxin [Reichenbachiella ulvae]|uniref:Type II toxin-antitoxin system ParD family antitoxin n=1 Tax=Reichenbachiella ulvae TaxID=2980104 RepID=A0ABT3CNN4_9BACT|nr:type II toxin-antitoxin system ParD family antitoxin [Reichenbachiella ulvae]MCV9385217.1 type II toxin-antitoxin system ParD family antitoxin [Reichenbachiella ulvae]
MAKNTSIALGDHFDNFVSTSVKSGRYNSASEVIRAALRLLEEQEEKKNILLKAIKEGEESGLVEDFDPQALLDELHSRHNIQ